MFIMSLFNFVQPSVNYIIGTCYCSFCYLNWGHAWRNHNESSPGTPERSARVFGEPPHNKISLLLFFALNIIHSYVLPMVIELVWCCLDWGLRPMIILSKLIYCRYDIMTCHRISYAHKDCYSWTHVGWLWKSSFGELDMWFCWPTFIDIIFRIRP